jgi:hypothetical protein
MAKVCFCFDGLVDYYVGIRGQSNPLNLVPELYSPSEDRAFAPPGAGPFGYNCLLTTGSEQTLSTPRWSLGLAEIAIQSRIPMSSVSDETSFTGNPRKTELSRWRAKASQESVLKVVSVQ